MGVESFFLHCQLSIEIDIDFFSNLLSEGGFEVMPYFHKYDGLFTSTVKSKEIVIERIILCGFEKNYINFQACFSCYEKAVEKMFDCLYYLHKRVCLKEISYGGIILNASLKDKASFAYMMYEINNKRLASFRQNYTSHYIEILPHDFYRFYNRHRRELKK